MLDVMFAKQRDVEPEVFAVLGLDALAHGNAFFHAAGNHVAGGEFLLFRFHVRHEAVAVNVAEQTAVTAAAFRHQNAGRENARRVELNGFHVRKRGNAGGERQVVTHAVANDRVRRDAVDTAGTAGGDGSGLGHVGHQFARDQVTDDSAVAALAVVNQTKRFNAFDHRNLFCDEAVGHHVEHGVAGTVGDVAGTPLLRAAEVTLIGETRCFLAFGNRDLFTVDDHLTVARGDAAPGTAPGGEFAHSLGRGVHKHADDFLISAPVRTADRITEMDVFIVAQAFDHVAERCLHTALSGLGVAALRRNEGKDDRVVTAALGSNSHAESSKAAADDQHVGVNDFHEFFLGNPAYWAGGSERSSCLRIRPVF